MFRTFVLVAALFLCSCDDAAFYADGTPWENVAVPFRMPRVPLKQLNERELNQFFAQAGIQATGSGDGGSGVHTFTPTNWTGFSVDPVGNLKYMDLGAIVVMWADANLLGTSDDVGMSFSGLPEAIWPSSNRFVRCLVVNNYTEGGAAEVTLSGIIQFSLEDVSGAYVGTADNNRTVIAGAIFENTGSKGLPSGWLIMYPK